jgi:RNA polymerase sigma factor (sigma-70 family)
VDWCSRGERAKISSGAEAEIFCVSMDATFGLARDGNAVEVETLANLLPDNNLDPCATALKVCEEAGVRRAVSRLPPREARVMRLHYGNELTFKQIGVILSVSESRAYQLHQQGLGRLRQWMEVRA